MSLKSAGGGRGMGSRVPRWDADAQELWAGTTLLKRFKHPPLLVGAELAEFEKHGWPHCIKSPFAGKPRAKDRLRDARKLLHRYQRAIEFHCTDFSNHMTWRWRQ